MIPFADGEDMLFTLRGRSHAMRLAPSQGDEGTLVESRRRKCLTGPGRWRCRFGDLDVRGRVVSLNKVACPAPAGKEPFLCDRKWTLVDDAYGTSDAPLPSWRRRAYSLSS